MLRIGFHGLLALFLLPSVLLGQEPGRLGNPIQPSPEGEAAISQLRSPFCPGLMLEVCPSPQAKSLRDTINMMANEGVAADSIVNWMLSSYGEQYRAVPKAQGSGLWAWVMPPLALVGGLFAVFLALRHFRARGEAKPRVEEELSEEDESVLEKALEELKASEEVPF
jgi:cytochrome c-type biogenesis protein CcmH